jgi:L-ascorbate metabolism protein UlaG (beta-lactamase superfamily)
MAILIPAAVILSAASTGITGGITGCAAYRDVKQTFISPAPPPVTVAQPVREGVRLSALWVGHSTVLLQMDDRVILTDPLLTGHVSFFETRVVEPGIDIANIPHCDIILLSHTHADHLDIGSLRMLESRFPRANLIFPNGAEEYIPRLSFPMTRLRTPAGDEVTGESRTIDSVRITTIPARHWGGRYGLDGLLWKDDGYTGYIIEYHGMTVLFAGDTGYDPSAFTALGERYSIDLALLPIGPAGDSLGGPNHVSPLGALRILSDTKAKNMIPIHYGTLYEATDTVQPRRVLEELLMKDPEARKKVSIPEIGGQLVVE